VIDRQLRRTALLVAGCFFMENLDGTIVVTAIPRISRALDVSAASCGLVVAAYLTTLAVLIPVSGWLTARYGARPVFLTAIGVFTVASLGCALSTSLAVLVALRVLQGLGGALMVPVGRMVVFGAAEQGQIMRLMSYIVWPGLVAPVIAPLAGGVITTYAGWRWLFLINIPLGVVALLVARRVIHGGRAQEAGRLDRAGVLLTCTGLAALTYGAHLASGTDPAWGPAAAMAVAAVGLLAAAARHLLTTEQPLVNLRNLRIHTFAAAIRGSAGFWLVVGAIPFLLPLMFQTVFGWSAIRSGALVMFVFVGNIAIKPATTWIFRRFGFRSTLIVATVGLAATAAAMGLLDASTPLALVALIALLSGVARSVGLTGYSTLTLADVPPEQMRDANALAATNQQLFSGLGVTAAAVALAAAGSLEDLLPGGHGAGTAYTIAFGLLALVGLAASYDAVRLHPRAGSGLVRSG
jgi:EmrB/QacA subfamily drug resistance transporter